jgi:hypothetical protein
MRENGGIAMIKQAIRAIEKTNSEQICVYETNNEFRLTAKHEKVSIKLSKVELLTEMPPLDFSLMLIKLEIDTSKINDLHPTLAILRRCHTRIQRCLKRTRQERPSKPLPKL